MIRFSDIDDRVLACPGLYELHTRDGVALKVGIGRDLLRRLRVHRASRQSGLRPVGLDDLRLASDPAQVRSKASVLAKHLFFDAEIAPSYDLRAEAGRRQFLEEECRLLIQCCTNLEVARRLEREREQTGRWRYCGRVVVRPVP